MVICAATSRASRLGPLLLLRLLFEADWGLLGGRGLLLLPFSSHLLLLLLLLLYLGGLRLRGRVDLLMLNYCLLLLLVILLMLMLLVMLDLSTYLLLDKI